MNPRQHCRISVRRWGGVEGDYYPIHEFIDSTKTLCADGRHRVLHTHWAIQHVVVPIFGHTIVNADGKNVDVKDMCERDHLLADYGNRFIPTLADFISAVTVDDARLRQDLEKFHSEFAGDPGISELLLSPLAVTGRVKSLLVTHNSWFINAVLPRIFGVDPLIRDFDIVPAQLFNAMEFRTWMDNGLACPPSAKQLNKMQITPQLRSVR